MREILFRAQIMDSDEWVYGSLVYSQSEKQYYIVEHSCDELSYPVEEETIGQFTGLLDKNGDKIFEGDIVSFSSCYYNGNDTPYKGVVKWSDMQNISTRFMIWHDNESEYYGKDGAFDLDLVHVQDDEIEVIGNVYDNPELLSEVEE